MKMLPIDLNFAFKGSKIYRKADLFEACLEKSGLTLPSTFGLGTGETLVMMLARSRGR